ncbi:MAG TPA: kelch repeat-containing protein [Chitinophagales bacterium]|nr:hypothetical protein [Chitinophagales bacterium]HMX04688.1 kelch repeat-containing protein [Chitinophagales bacterium]HNA57621.1 kelch repeat-containing protein [Chitinophagales bacterium]HNE44895.1 kelch repeat-containing protein [Chitinophagales bacterium]HNF69653.1 kelch repeat-containing protein [Chitinophagales bacterium]
MQKIITTIICLLCAWSLDAQNTWSPVADFAGGERERAVAFTIGGRAYVGTGVDSANVCKKDFWEYDPGSNSWTQKADLPGSQRRDAIAFTIGNRGYVGTGLNGLVAWSGTKKKDFFEYNPITNTWTAKDDFEGNSGQGIYYASAFATTTKGYVICGKFGPSWYSNELWQYDPATDDWVKKANFPAGSRYGVSAFAIGDKGYVGCGADENYFTNDFYEYNEATNTWSEKASFPGSPRFNASAFAIDTRGFIGMGTDGGYQKDLYEYNPATDSWMQKANFPASERRSCVAFTINGYGYLGTGKGPTGLKRGMYKYKPYFFLQNETDDYRLAAVVDITGNTPRIIVQQSDVNTSYTLHVFNINGQLVFQNHQSGNGEFAIGDLHANGLFVYEIAATDINGEIQYTSGKLFTR